MANDVDKIADFHVRLGRLEQSVGEMRLRRRRRGDLKYSLLTAVLGLAFGILGFHFPNHWYQIAFAILIVTLMVHRGALGGTKTLLQKLLVVLDAVLLSIVMKLFIGGGSPRPLWWVRLPDIEGGLSSFKITWHEVAASNFAVPLTVIQTFFLILILFAVLVDFQLFASLAALILILFSIPAFVDFEWSWAIPALVMTGVSLYLQIGWTETADSTESDSAT